jgi:rSAM/selenodomain-associated transferase 1
MIPRQIIALFVKPPVPGRVKTRLARDIGNKAACRVYRKLADHAIRQIQASDYPLALFFDGNDPDLLPQAWRRAAMISLAQEGPDLGARMANAFGCLFARGAERVILTGSDIPEIDAAYLRQACGSLDHHHMVIGPAFDGGYCLIGFRRERFSADLFCGIPWSTDLVFELTLTAALALDLSVGMLPPIRDVDTLDDLRSVTLDALWFPSQNQSKRIRNTIEDFNKKSA